MGLAKEVGDGEVDGQHRVPIDHSNSGLKIDPAFVLTPEFRPNRRHDEYTDGSDGESIPLVDLSLLRSMPPSQQAEKGSILDYESKKTVLVEEVGKACKEWGFFQVINHGVKSELLDNLEQEMKKFFALSLEEKRRVKRSLEKPTVGYFDSELNKNVKDWKEVFNFVQGNMEMPDGYDDQERITGTCVYENLWPQNPPGFRKACEKWAHAMEKLSFELLSLITESMGLPAAYFKEHFRDNNTTFIRLNHYPACPSPELALGVSPHKDGGALTVLWQDQIGGLQVKRKNGQWIAVKPRRDAFIINVGYLFQVWSNDLFMSVEHRAVVNEQKNRYSIPYFFSPAHTTTVCPVPELLDKEHPAKYKPYNWGHSLRRKAVL